MITTVPRHEISLSVLPIVSTMRNTTIAIKGSEHIMTFLYLKQIIINNYTTILNEEKEQLSKSFNANVWGSDWVVSTFILCLGGPRFIQPAQRPAAPKETFRNSFNISRQGQAASGRLLSAQRRTLRFHKMWGNIWLAQKLLVFFKMNCNSTELDGYSHHPDKCWNRALKYVMTDIFIIYEYPSIWWHKIN